MSPPPRSASDGSHGTNPGSLPTRIPATASSRRQNLDNTTSPHTPLARPPTDSTSRITAEQRVLLRIYSYFLLFACIHSMNMTPEHMQSLCDDATDSSLLHPCSNTSAICPYESALSQTRLTTPQRCSSGTLSITFLISPCLAHLIGETELTSDSSFMKNFTLAHMISSLSADPPHPRVTAHYQQCLPYNCIFWVVFRQHDLYCP